MHKSTTTKSLFLNDESSFAGLSQIAGALQLVNSQNALDRAARQVIEMARRSRVSRDIGSCSRACSAVLALPASEGLRNIAEFYTEVSQRTAAFDAHGSRQALARRATNTEPAYVARVILEVALTYDREGNLPEALRYYLEAAKAAGTTDGLTAAQAADSLAVLRSDDGDHPGALRELERLLPIIVSISHTYPHLYYSYANDRAVVLSRAGRIEESRRAIQVALASPLAPRFPEWHETAREIEEAARKEPRRESPTFRIAAAEVRRPGANEAPVRKTRDRQSILFIAVARRADPAAGTPSVFRNTNVSSLLERYVKTVRIRDRP